jgi:hypothetical protein
MNRLACLQELVLGPLRERPDADWQEEVGGKWSPAQIVEHLALGLELSAQKFEQRREHAPMSRRRRTPAEQVARLFIMGLRWFPAGRKAPERTVPASGIGRHLAEAHFLAGLAAWQRLEQDLLPRRGRDLFVKHPRLGDLTMEEWIKFHGVHARHHARQIRRRLAG